MDEAVEDFLRSGGFSVRPGWTLDELFEICEVVSGSDGGDELRLRFREGVVKGPGSVVGAEDPGELLSTVATESPREVMVLSFSWDEAPEELVVLRIENGDDH